MKIAVLGGSFNPIQIAHLALADEVCKNLGYDKVLFVPSFNPPHKDMNNPISPEHRVNMIKIACRNDSRFVLEDCEIQRKGTSYTIDTINYLYEKYEGKLDDKIGLIMGDDLFAGFHLWKNAQELAEKCQLILARRPYIQETNCTNVHKGEYSNVSHGEAAFDISTEPLFKAALLIENALLAVSSTDIRNRVSSGKAYKFLVPAGVAEYIEKHKLYSNNQIDYKEQSKVIYDYIQQNLKPTRFEHSLRVAKMAQEIAARYNQNQEQAYFAGLAHDMCKYMNHQEVLEYAKKSGFKLTKDELKSPEVLHGKAAVTMLRDEFHIDQWEVLEAVANHTLGNKGLCNLSKIIFLADKIEEGRPQSTKEYRENLMSHSLDKMTFLVIEEDIEYLISKNKSIAKVTKLFYKDLRNKTKGEQK